jgi:hypothetical protein
VRFAVACFATIVGGACKPTSVPERTASAQPVAGTPTAPPVAPHATLDAGIDANNVEWPIGIEFEDVVRDDTVGSGVFQFSVSYPRFRTKPPGVGREINAKLAPLAAVDFDPKEYQGELFLRCSESVVNRLVVIMKCPHYVESRTLAERDQGTVGAPAGPDPHAVAWWLQPGLPPVTLDQLAPGIDVRAMIETAQAQPNLDDRCGRDPCKLDPASFEIDADGIRLVPVEYCTSACDAMLPRIRLDQLRPTHPWAKKLVAWIKQRVEAGESLIKNDG